jgi:hypothetical protein
MNKLLIASFFFVISFSTWGTEVTWKAENKEFKLLKIGSDGYTSQSCVKDCSLKSKALAKLPTVTQEELSGGKVPASVVCKKVGGQVIYLSHGEQEEAFCVQGKDIVSLGLLLP